MIHLPAPRLCRCGVVHRDGIPRNLAELLRPYRAVYLSTTAKNLMLDQLDESLATGADFGSLHTAYSTTGANEVTGGSPAYARKALTWAAAASGAKALAATLPTWDVPASTTVAWWGGWDAVTAGTFLFMMPVGASLPTNMSVDAGDVTANTIQSEAHGLTTNDRVVFWPGSGSGLPAGLSVGTLYHVIATGLTVDVFSVSTTQGGSAVDITDEGGGLAQKCVPEVFAGQGTYALSSASIDLAAVV
jgi:hypothetical protein